jgi:hypothetical protein
MLFAVISRVGHYPRIRNWATRGGTGGGEEAAGPFYHIYSTL